MSQLKGMKKPLKGIGTLGRVAYVSAEQIIASSITVPGLIDVDGLLENVIINNAVINNTQIGVENPNVGYFTILQSGREGEGYTVLFYGFNDDYVLWDPDNSMFEIAGGLSVRDCSLLGNIRICENVISSELTDQDIIVRPNGIGDLLLQGGFEQRTTVGNFETYVNNGRIRLISGNEISIASSNNSVSLDSKSDLLLSTVNGDVNIRTDTGAGSTVRKFFSSIVQDSPNVLQITTTTPHNFKTGDSITISSSNSIPSINGSHTVLSTPSTSTFLITGGVTQPGTSGIATRLANNNVNFLMSSGGNINIPYGIPVKIGANNSLVGYSTGITLSSGNLYIPRDTSLTFNSHGSIYIDGNDTLHVGSTSQVTITTPTTVVSGNSILLDTDTARFKDPILTIGGLIGTPTNDLKDRGVEYYWANTSGSKLGWFGVKNSSGRFSFIPDATNVGEIVSGNTGDVEVKGVYAKDIFMNSTGNLSMGCGNITDVKEIRGCGSLTIVSTTGSVITNANDELVLTGRNGVTLNSENHISVANSIPLRFGTAGSNIVNSGGNLRIVSNTIETSTGNFILQTGSELTLGGQKILNDSSGNLILVAQRDIGLIPSSGNVLVPDLKKIVLGASGNSVSGSGNNLVISGANSVDIVSNTVGIVSSALNLSSGSISIPATTITRIGETVGVVSTSIGNLVVKGTVTNNLVITDYNTVSLTTDTVRIPQGSKLTLGNNQISTTSTGALELVGSTGSINLIKGSSQITVDTTTEIRSAEIVLAGNLKTTDPIVEIGSGKSAAVDRGITFTANSEGKFFGYESDTGRFVYYDSAIVSGDTVSGTLGNIEVGGIYSRNIYFTTRGSLDLSCGVINNVSAVNAGTCNSLTVSANDVTVTTTQNTTVLSENILLSARNSVQIPETVNLRFGTVGSVYTTSGRLVTKVGNSTLTTDSFGVNLQSNIITLNTEALDIADPVIRVGRVSSTNIDRGFEFIKASSGSTGFIGYKRVSDSFVYYKASVDTGTEIIGTLGNLQVADILADNLTLQRGTINSNSNLALNTSSGNVLLNPKDSVIVKEGKPISFGTEGNVQIVGDTSGQLVITALDTLDILTGGDITIDSIGDTTISSENTLSFLAGDSVSMSSGSVALNESTVVSFGTQGTSGGYSTTIGKDTSGTLIVQNYTGGIYLSSGSISVPETSPIVFGQENVNIYGEDDRLYINGYRGTIISGDETTFLGNLNIIGNITSTNVDTDVIPFIYPLGTNNILDITRIAQISGGTAGGTVGSSIIEIQTDGAHYLKIGDEISIKNTNTEPRLNGTFTVSNVMSNDILRILSTISLTQNGTEGKLISKLVTDPGKDVGIGVNWHTGFTTGTVEAQTGFFGFKRNTERWTFFRTGTITDNVFNGTLGNIEASKAFLDRISGFVLDGAVSAGSNKITGTNFEIGGGSIDNTPIGVNSANVGRFTALTSTVQTNVNNQTVSGRMSYSTERFTVSSANPSINPSNIHMVTFISVSGISFNGSGTMPNGTSDGQVKTVVFSAMGANCTYVLNFASGKLIAPNPLNPSLVPTKITFKRKGQSINLIWDDVGQFWVPSGGNGGYIE
jgi:hypothetical protein